MKKLLALILALTMVLTGLSAFADTIYTKVAVDPEVTAGLLAGFGVPEDQMSMIDPIVALVNALGINVITAADGAQIDLDLNGENALSLGFAMDGQGATLVSTLFPNYAVTVSQQTIEEMMKQFAENMPGAGSAGGQGGMDMNAMMGTLGAHIQPWMEACSAAGKPGDPVPGDYEFEGHKFDTMVPVTVDMAAITEATQKLLDDLLADPAAMAAIKGMAQGMARNNGQEFNEASFEADFKAGFQEWMAHFPATGSANYYTNSDSAGIPFYMDAEALREGETEPFTCYMLMIDEKHMKMGYQDGQTTAAGFEMDGTDMSMFFQMGSDMYMGLAMSFPEGQFAMDIYFMNADKPLASVTVTMAQGGERTLDATGEGKTVVAVEDAMSGQGDAMNGLMGDIMTNGMSALGVLTQQVPEVAGLMGMFMGGGEAMAG